MRHSRSPLRLAALGVALACSLTTSCGSPQPAAPTLPTVQEAYGQLTGDWTVLNHDDTIIGWVDLEPGGIVVRATDPETAEFAGDWSVVVTGPMERELHVEIASYRVRGVRQLYSRNDRFVLQLVLTTNDSLIALEPEDGAWTRWTRSGGDAR